MDILLELQEDAGLGRSCLQEKPKDQGSDLVQKCRAWVGRTSKFHYVC